MNNINIIGQNNVLKTNISDINKSEKGSNEFSLIFNNFLDKVNETDAKDKQQNTNLMIGEADNLHNVLISAEEADLALRLTLQIRNKVIDAYTEVMRMQI